MSSNKQNINSIEEHLIKPQLGIRQCNKSNVKPQECYP